MKTNKLLKGYFMPIKIVEKTLIVMHVYEDGARLGSSKFSWNEIKDGRAIEKLKVTLEDETFEFDPNANSLVSLKIC